MAVPPPRKAKVPLYGNPNKTVFVEDGATAGAKIGTNLQLPDGTVPTLEQLAIALGFVEEETGLTLAYTIWNLIQEIPPNIVYLAALTGNGFAVRKSDGTWIVRDVTTADATRIVVTNEDGDSGNATIDLAEVTPDVDGELVAILVDAYGRVTAMREAVLDDLADVDAPTPADGDVLSFDSGSGNWVNTPGSGVGGSGYPAHLGYAGM